MHCQKHLVASFFLILGVFPELQNASAASISAFDKIELILHGVDSPVVSGSRSPEEIACTMSWVCPSGSLDHQEALPDSIEGLCDNQYELFEEAELNLTLTLSSSTFERRDLPPCEDLLERFLFSQKEALPESLGPLNNRPAQSVLKSSPVPTWFRRAQSIHAPRDQLERTPKSSRPSQAHKGLFDYFRGLVSHRHAVQAAAKTAREGKLALRSQLKYLQPSNPVGSWAHSKQKIRRKITYPHGNTCEHTVCKGYNLEKICGRRKDPGVEMDVDDVCNMCFPTENVALVREHCAKVKWREIQVFKFLCAALGVVTLVAGLLYLIREMCKPLGRRWELYWRMRSSQVSRSPTMRSRFSSILSMESTAAFRPSPVFNTGADPERAEYGAPGSTTTFSTFGQTIGHIGAMVKDRRRRVMEVFDLESLQARDHQEDPCERIPVLPRASTASLRKAYADDSPERGRRRIRETYFGESNDQFASIMPLSDAHAKNVP